MGHYKTKDLSGNKYNRLTILERDYSRNRIYYKCQCDCGKIVTVRADSIINGQTQSCGCLFIERHTKHGMEGTLEYYTYNSMIQRCKNPNSPDYKNYGGRGIVVCERWKKFENFYEDMGRKPNGAVLDRIDNSGHYEPSNCRWTTIDLSNQNRRMYIVK